MSASTGVRQASRRLEPMEDVIKDEDRDWFVGEVGEGPRPAKQVGVVHEGLDSQTHHVFVIDVKGCKVGERGFTHGGEDLAEIAA